MHRRHVVLGGLLLLQIALILIFRSPFGAASVRQEARPLLPALGTIEPTKIEIQGAGTEHITLARNGESWSLEELGGFPADAKKVQELLTNLKGLKVRRPVVESSRYHEQFKVLDKTHEGRVRVWGAGPGGEPLVDLLLGSSPDYRTMHVRPAGADPVYEVRGLAAYDLRPDSGAWIAKEVVAAPEGSVTELTVTNQKGSFEIKKQEDKWVVAAPQNMSGRALDAEKATALVRSVTSLRLSQAAGRLDDAAQGLASPAATLVVKWAAEQPGERTIRIGTKLKDKDTERYVTWSGFGYSGTVWDSSVTRLLDEGLDALLAS